MVQSKELILHAATYTIFKDTYYNDSSYISEEVAEYWA